MLKMDLNVSNRNADKKGLLIREQYYSRRKFLSLSALGSFALLCQKSLLGQNVDLPAVTEITNISFSNTHYSGWPTICRRNNGQLLLVYSGGREGHVCPFGRVEMMVSKDDGKTWSWPRVLLDTDIDDRDAGVLETKKGTLLVTTFTSLAYESILNGALKKNPGDTGAWAAERLKRWKAAHERLNDDQRKRLLGQWMMRSTDGGVSWSTPYASLANSPHGPLQLEDGRILYAGKELWTGEKRTGIAESLDDGATWRWLADMPVRKDDKADNYHELHAVEAPSGRIIVHIRNHNPANNNEILQSESGDHGKSWSIPHPIGVWGLPSHLLRLRNGNILMTYGYRRVPYGNQARISKDEGRTWSEPITLSNDGTSGDLGYPSTVELSDGSLLSVWYELVKGSSMAVLRQGRWRL